MAEQICEYCGEPVQGGGVRRGHLVYCSEACAFEASRSKDCSGRSDSTVGQGVVEPADR